MLGRVGSRYESRDLLFPWLGCLRGDGFIITRFWKHSCTSDMAAHTTVAAVKCGLGVVKRSSTAPQDQAISCRSQASRIFHKAEPVFHP